MPSASFQNILDTALAEYTNQIGIDPASHPLAGRLQTCHSPDDVLELLEDHAKQFKDYRDGNRKLIDCLKPVVTAVHALSSVLSEAVRFAPFPPAKAIFVGVDVLFAAAIGVSSSYDALVDLFDCVGNFLNRLQIYTDLPLTPSMTATLVKIMVELFTVLALATQQIKQGRFKAFAKKLLGDSKIEAVLRRLDRLTQEESRMTVAQTFDVVHCLMNNMKVVMGDGKASIDDILTALDTMQQMAGDINMIKRNQFLKESRSWLSPPDPSSNYNTAREMYQDGTATWLLEGSVFGQWNEKGSLLWIYGKPGSGKTILMSSIIREINRMRKAGLALMAYFFFDFRDTRKQHRRGLLSSLLCQLSTKSDACYQIFSRLYHDEGAQQPSDDALFDCLKEMLNVQGQPAVYLIIDALDECPNVSGIPTSREKVLKTLEDLVRLQLPNLHICVSSRPEFDIRTSLEPVEPFRVFLDEESGQKADILTFITSFVDSDRKIRKWSAEYKQLIIDTLSDKVDGMFRWVYCQLEVLRRCLPTTIRDTLHGLPKTLDATYESTLLRLDEEQRQFACRLFQCLTVSVRPLRVEELAEVLAVKFSEGALSQLITGWRPGDAEEAVLTVCSSFIAIVNENGSRIVQFSHFSVKEFLTSERLATTSENLSCYHIVPHSAHATLAQTSLSVLLQLDNRIDKESIQNFPLADYAARHWFEHGQFEEVSPAIQDATKYLFDRGKGHFSTWIWIYDIDDHWRRSMPTKHPEQPEATPLYYSILCGLRWLIEHLLATYPEDVNASGGYHGTPLLAAVRREDVDIFPSLQADDGKYMAKNRDISLLQHGSFSKCIDIVQLLLEHNADVNLSNEVGETPLYGASRSGALEILQVLFQQGADIHCQDKNDWTPLKTASHGGHLDVVQFSIDNGADVNSHDNEGRTALHSASEGHLDIVELLIRHGADIHKQSDDSYQVTPLHLASCFGHVEILQVLFQQGADIHCRDKNDWTPLKTASHGGHLNVVQFLIDNGADVNSHDNEGHTALHSASQGGHLDNVELLIQHGADIHKQSDDSHQVTPLYLASFYGHVEILQVLFQQGADIHCRNKVDWTPLKTASHGGHLDVVRFLIDSGADVNSHDNEGRTALHSASQEGHLDIVELLIQHGADIHKQSDDLYQVTPLHMASDYGHVEILRLLVHEGADIHRKDSSDRTPLKIASQHGHLGVVRFLIDSGADVNSHDNTGWTCLHEASQGHLDILELLIRHGADIHKQSVNLYQITPLHVASGYGHVEILQLLVQHGADIHCRNKKDWTPLQVASEEGNLDVVQFLINSGADVNSHDNEGCTSLHSAAHRGQLDVVRLLLQHGADFGIRNNKNKTASDLASDNGHISVVVILSRQVESSMSSRGHLNVVNLLQQRGAYFGNRNNINQMALDWVSVNGNIGVADILSRLVRSSMSPDGAANTTLSTISPPNGPPNIAHNPRNRGDHASSFYNDGQDRNLVYTAARIGDLDLMQSLLDYGSDVNERYTFRVTALHVAAQFGKVEIAKLLIERGADVDSRDRQGWTPLIMASHYGELDVVQLLLDHGADANAKTRHRETALHRASHSTRFEIVRLLLERGANVEVRDAAGQAPRQLAVRVGNRKILELLSGFGA